MSDFFLRFVHLPKLSALFVFLAFNFLVMLLFFDIGTGELILILLVVFVVMGPKQLPEVARTIGKTINEMKRASAGFTNEINKEIQRLDRETRLNDFLEQRADNARPQAGIEPSADTSEEVVAALPDAEETKPAPQQAEDETGRVEREM